MLKPPSEVAGREWSAPLVDERPGLRLHGPSPAIEPQLEEDEIGFQGGRRSLGHQWRRAPEGEQMRARGA